MDRQPRATRHARLDWLLAHPVLWAHAPGEHEDVTPMGRAMILAIGEQMVREGLYSVHTEVGDRSWGIRILIDQARKQLEV